jgi:hypothetical protein
LVPTTLAEKTGTLLSKRLCAKALVGLFLSLMGAAVWFTAPSWFFTSGRNASKARQQHEGVPTRVFFARSDVLGSIFRQQEFWACGVELQDRDGRRFRDAAYVSGRNDDAGAIRQTAQLREECAAVLGAARSCKTVLFERDPAIPERAWLLKESRQPGPDYFQEITASRLLACDPKASAWGRQQGAFSWTFQLARSGARELVLSGSFHRKGGMFTVELEERSALALWSLPGIKSAVFRLRNLPDLTTGAEPEDFDLPLRTLHTSQTACAALPARAFEIPLPCPSFAKPDETGLELVLGLESGSVLRLPVPFRFVTMRESHGEGGSGV